MTDACSMESFGFCAQARHGAIYRRHLAHTRPGYSRFVRRGRAGVWDQIMDALAETHDAQCK